MLFFLLKFIHLMGVLLVAVGFMAVLTQDLFTRYSTAQHCHIGRSAAQYGRVVALQLMSNCYSFVALPGAIIVVVSGGGLVASYYHPTEILNLPWLAGMVGLFSIGLLVSVTYSRRHLHNLIAIAWADRSMAVFARLRDKSLPVLVRGLEVPFLVLIIAIGVFRPETWAMLITGIGFALQGSLFLVLLIFRLSDEASFSEHPIESA